MLTTSTKPAYKGIVILTLLAFMSFSFFSSVAEAQWHHDRSSSVKSADNSIFAYRDNSGDLPGMDDSNTATTILIVAAVLAVGVGIFFLIKGSKKSDKKEDLKKDAKPDTTSFQQRQVLDAEREMPVELIIGASQKPATPLGQTVSLGLSFKF
ncbi:MAG: hypothetical protein HGB11_09010 [Chlorobiales bacterium]|nr:hypothetical protein [Chlorobiales bacterium]